ncbi:unnamed protein product [Musa banksii]
MSTTNRTLRSIPPPHSHSVFHQLLRHFHQLRAQPHHQNTELYLIQRSISVHVALPQHPPEFIVLQPLEPQRGGVPPEAVERDQAALGVHQQLKPLAELRHQPFAAQLLRHRRQEVLETD